jgi:hypothetical protein
MGSINRRIVVQHPGNKCKTLKKNTTANWADVA